MPTVSDQYRKRVQRIARHEMGHYIASRQFGFRTGDVSVQVDGLTGGHRGGATIELNRPVHSMDDIDEYLCQRIIILFAGALSEPLFAGAPVKAIGESENAEAVRVLDDPQSGAAFDHAKVRELRAVLRNIRHSDTKSEDTATILTELKAINDDLWGRAIKLVDRHYETICGLATNLTARLKREKEEIVIQAAELEALPAVVAITPVRSDEFD